MRFDIIFDLGGVVVNFDPKSYLTSQFDDESTRNQLFKATFASPEWQLFDRGDYSFSQLTDLFIARGREMGLEKEIRQLLSSSFDYLLTTREEMAAMMAQLAGKGIRLFYLSNLPHEIKTMLQKRSFWGLFSGGIASCDVALLKQDKAIYALLLEKYSLASNNCLFFDDTAANVTAAREAGLVAYHFTSNDDFRQQLAHHGIQL